MIFYRRTLIRHMSLIIDSTCANHYLAAECSILNNPLKIVTKKRNLLNKDQVRIKIMKSAINFADILLMQGKYQVKMAVPYIPGMEVSGDIIEIGSGVKNIKVGDIVVALMMDSNGGFAQEAVTSYQNVVPINNPNNKNYDQLASLLASYGTAYLALTRHAQIKSMDKVLVTAAAGALGLAAVDLSANVFGCDVIGACGDDSKIDLIKKYGAKKVFNYKTNKIRDELNAFSSGNGVDIVFDAVGGSILVDSLKSLSFEGRLLTVGYASGDIPQIPANLLLVKNISAHGVYWGSYSQKLPKVFMESVKAVTELWSKGKIKPHVGKIYSLNQVNDAMKFIQNRGSTGKILLDCQNL